MTQSRDEPCSGGGTLSPDGIASDPAAGRSRRGADGVDTTGDRNQDVADGNPGNAAAAAAAVAGLQRKVAEKSAAHSVAVATAAAAAAITAAAITADAGAATAASTPQGRNERGEAVTSSTALESKENSSSGSRRDGGGKGLRRVSSGMRSRGSSEGGGAAATGIASVVGGSASSTMSSESSVSVTAEQRDEDAATRGRRISETEGAVKTMRKKLSAMGFLEADDSDCPRDGGGDAAGEGSKVAGEDSVDELPMDTFLESRGQPLPRLDAAAGVVIGGGAAATAVGAADQEDCLEHADAIGANDGRENHRPTTEMVTACPPPEVKPDEKQPPLPLPSPPPPPTNETASPLPSAEHAGHQDATADQSSGCLAVAADVGVTTDDADSSHASGMRVGVDSERSPSRLLQIPDGCRTPPGSGGSALSSGRRQRHRRRRKHTPTAESETDIGSRRQASPYSPVDDRVVILPRPDSEYEAALCRLTEAASHAAELYRELTQASSASLASRGTGAGGTGEGSVAGMESFPSTSSSGLGRGSHGLGGIGLGRVQAGESRRRWLVVFDFLPQLGVDPI